MEIRYHISQIDKIAKSLIAKTQSRTLLFYAAMGAGKTTLIKAILTELGAADAGNSPTFGIVNEYHNHNGELLAYHFDFYRLEDETEALDLGLEDYLNQDVWIFIEWPEKVASFLPNRVNSVYLEILDMERRSVRLE